MRTHRAVTIGWGGVPIAALWREHQACRRDNGRLLWNLLMLQRIPRI